MTKARRKDPLGGGSEKFTGFKVFKAFSKVKKTGEKSDFYIIP